MKYLYYDTHDTTVYRGPMVYANIFVDDIERYNVKITCVASIYNIKQEMLFFFSNNSNNIETRSFHFCVFYQVVKNVSQMNSYSMITTNNPLGVVDITVKNKKNIINRKEHKRT